MMIQPLWFLDVNSYFCAFVLNAFQKSNYLTHNQMKKSLFAFSFLALTVSMSFAQSNGTLTVTATTSTAGGNYAPKNVVAIWIEDNQGNFVKTLLAYAQTRKTHLNTWEASTTAFGSPFNTVDAITGATKSSHSTRTCTWNGTDVNGTLVPDGTYKVRMELTDKNNTGNFSTFTFTKGSNAETQNHANVPSFASITINWEPVITAVNDPELEKNYCVFPNPASSVIRVLGEDILEIEVLNLAGSILYKGKSETIDVGNQPEGIYYVKISTGKGVVTKKVVKK